MDKGLYRRLQGELDAREKTPGLTVADLLAMPESLGQLLEWMIRQGQVELGDISAFIGQDETCTRTILSDLLEKGFIREIEMRDAKYYRVRLAPKRKHELPHNLWEALNKKVEE